MKHDSWPLNNRQPGFILTVQKKTLAIPQNCHTELLKATVATVYSFQSASSRFNASPKQSGGSDGFTWPSFAS